MKLLKTLGLIFVLLFTMNIAYAQKQRFDVVSFSLPKDWQKKQNDGGLQLSITDDKTGAYAIAVITKAKASSASSTENFNADWAKLVAGSVKVNGNPKIDSPVKENSWEIVSGSANYTDADNKGLATLLTATGGGRTVSVVLMTNSSQYQNDLLALIKSLELAETSQIQNSSADVSPGQGSTKTNSSIVGMWCYYNTESNGSYNGFPQLTGGYFRKEYTFYGDGTYLFRLKNWAVLVKEIQYVFESGTWKMTGSKLTVTPKTGKAGWWSKAASGRTVGWGRLVKAGVWKLEPVTYNVDLHYYPGIKETHLILKSPSQTQREGKLQNNTLIYTPRKPNKSLIDNPPGLKTGFENKALKGR